MFYFVPLVMEKVVLASESLFGPANSMRSTRLLVKIHNTCPENSRHPLLEKAPAPAPELKTPTVQYLRYLISEPRNVCWFWIIARNSLCR